MVADAVDEAVLAELAEQEARAIVGRAEARRVALMGENSALRQRYEEIMQWVNPPWDNVSRRINPQASTGTPDRQGGEPKIHIDQVSQVVMRWSVLEAGSPFDFRVEPRFVAPPIPNPGEDPQKTSADREEYNIERLQAEIHATHMEAVTNEWLDLAAAHRTLLWAAWVKRAFGKAILRDGWDPDEGIPTLELMENPADVYYGWSKLYGNRKLQWVNVAEAMSPEEANYRFNLNLSFDANGLVDLSSWGYASMEHTLDARPEQMGSRDAMVYAEEYWELDRSAPPDRRIMQAFIVAGRIIDGPHYYPWQRLPFHVFENEHIPTYPHGKSTAEQAIPINSAYNDMLDRQHRVIEFESGPRYQGLNMYHARDEVDVPAPFGLLPLREGEEIRQIDTRVDFFPTQLHGNELRESMYDTTGLTPIAWGRSPNAQTSGRALSAEWRAVELPLHSALINITPDLIDILKNWWDYAEAYDEELQGIGKGYRRFKALWKPLDVRDSSERTLDVIQLLNANLLDPETALEERGYENASEILQRVKVWLVDPVYNPLRYQQYLVLKQLSLQIQMQEAEMEAMQQQAAPPEQQANAQVGGPGAPSQPEPAPPEGQVAEYMNQPGQSPDGGGLPVETGILSRTPLEGGSGNQITASVGGGGIPVG